jgi:dihydroflavonol-4-reductase
VPDVFITGGTGFIGAAVLERLVAEGRSIRALVRSERDAERLSDRGVEPVRGDIGDEDALLAGMAGVDTVFHVAGLNEMCLRDPGRLDRINVGGTRAVVRAASRADVARVVYTSSAAAIGEPAGVTGTEATPHRGSYVTAYERSKHRAEVAAFADAARLGVPLVAVNPSSVQGPGRTGGTARILIAFLRGRLRVAIDTRLSVVSIGDTVTAHLLAESRGEPGERYLVSGWSTTVAEAVATMAAITGSKRRVRYLPAWMLGGAARVVGAAFRLIRRDAPLCSEMARALRHGHTYDGSRIEREWGFAYTPPDEWLAGTIEWYRSEGIVP